jgi:hypothetical protein
LDYWRNAFGLDGFGTADLAPWFERMERRVNVARWAVAPNENNDALRRGAQALGFSVGTIRRNVKGCWNIGYCGVGCPTNAKQSMLVTTIPAALVRGATLLTRTRAWKLEHANGRNGQISALECPYHEYVPAWVFVNAHWGRSGSRLQRCGVVQSSSFCEVLRCPVQRLGRLRSGDREKERRNCLGDQQSDGTDLRVRSQQRHRLLHRHKQELRLPCRGKWRQILMQEP